MLSIESQSVADRGEAVYQALRPQLERQAMGQFVSIEPVSGEYFLGRSLDEAIGFARKAHPDRVTYTCRIGWPVAVQIGGCR